MPVHCPAVIQHQLRHWHMPAGLPPPRTRRQKVKADSPNVSMAPDSSAHPMAPGLVTHMLSPPGASCGCPGHHPPTPSPWIRAVGGTASGYCAQGPGVRQLQLSALAPHMCLEPPWPPSLAHTFPDTCPNKPPHTPSSHQVRLWPVLCSPCFWFIAPSAALCPCSRPLSKAPAGTLQDSANTQRGIGSTGPSMLAGTLPGRNPLNSKFQAGDVHTKWPAQSPGNH